MEPSSRRRNSERKRNRTLGLEEKEAKAPKGETSREAKWGAKRVADRGAEEEANRKARKAKRGAREARKMEAKREPKRSSRRKPKRDLRKDTKERLGFLSSVNLSNLDSGHGIGRNLMRNKLTAALGAMRPRQGKLDDPYYTDHLPEGANIFEMQEKFPEYEERILNLYRPGSLVDTVDLSVPPPRLLEATYQRKGLKCLAWLLHEGYMSFLGYKPESYEAKSIRRREVSADTRYPQEWYTQTRQYRRIWHLHVGPTNSGKTYHALKRLEETRNGIYGGPLRLLAYEVYERMNAKGIPCDLVTGDDVRIVGNEAMIESSTMEMVDLSKEVDVCVIDEIQMIGDKERGWAWTQAVLGVKAKEVHMCGEERAVDIIQMLADTVGDKLIIHRYERLGPLEVLPHSLEGDLKKLEPGDCVVTFSRRNIFTLKSCIEKVTGRRCAVVYGSLPPEVRSAQARLFNDPDSEYEILVASDAIGMGLNLSIKRIIFESMEKFNGKMIVPIAVPQVKQIAGRAGRYRPASATTTPAKPGESVACLPAAPQVGYVTTFDESDRRALCKAMETEPTQIKTAGVLPQVQHVIKFAAQFPPGEKFSKILRALRDEYSASTFFHTCSLEDQLSLANLLDDVDLSVAERMIVLMAPVSSDPINILAAKRIAQCIADRSDGSVLNIPEINIEALNRVPETKDDLKMLETLHKALIMYIWLSYRFPATLTPRETALELRDICEAAIEKGLKAIGPTSKTGKLLGQQRQVVEGSILGLGDGIQPQALDIPRETEEAEEDSDIDYTSLRRLLQKRPTIVSTWCFNCGLQGHMSRRCPNERKKIRQLPVHVRKELLTKIAEKARA